MTRNPVDLAFRGGMRAAQVVLDRFYAQRHPGPIARAALKWASPATRWLVPNDRWSLPIHAPLWMRAALAPPREPLPNSRRIFLWCAYRGQFSFELPLAALLAWRGHHITLGYLPKLRSPIKQPLADAPDVGNYLKASLAGIEKITQGRVKVVDVSRFADASAPIDEDFLSKQIVSDSVMQLLRESVDPAIPEHRRSLEYCRDLGIAAQRASYGYLAPRRDAFDMALIANATTFEAAHVSAVARRLGLDFVAYEKFAFRDVRVITHGGDFRAFDDLELVWRHRDSLGYTEPGFKAFAAARAASLMDERRRASTQTWAWMLQRAPNQSAEHAMSAAGVDPARAFALICTNVPLDAGYDKLTRIFPSMREWLVETVRHLLTSTDIQVVVRCHPGEAAHYGGTERSEQNLAAAGLIGSNRLIVIPGEETINTYGLMEHCKFGVVFSSTTGLEMAMMGRRVAVGADVYYGNRGFTFDATDRDDYFLLLSELASGPASALTDEQIADARLFHFLLHFVMQWPFPWNKGGAVRDLPPDQLVRSPEIVRFIPTLDALATPTVEFRARLSDFLGAKSCAHVPRPPGCVVGSIEDAATCV